MTGKAKRGFAVMSVEMRTAIAAKGGQSARDRGTAHRFTSEEARRAARKSARIRQQQKQQKGAA